MESQRTGPLINITLLRVYVILC